MFSFPQENKNRRDQSVRKPRYLLKRIRDFEMTNLTIDETCFLSFFFLAKKIFLQNSDVIKKTWKK